MCVIYDRRRSIICSALVLGVGIGVYFYTRPQEPVGNPKPADPTIPLIGGSDNLLAAQDAKNDTSSKAGPSDHSMFSGTPSRNMVNLIDKNVPGPFEKEEVLLWKSQLGSRAYGGPIIARGKIVCGTNNDQPRNKRDIGKPDDDNPKGAPLDKGVVMCFDEKTGKFLWQAVHDKLPRGTGPRLAPRRSLLHSDHRWRSRLLRQQSLHGRLCRRERVRQRQRGFPE